MRFVNLTHLPKSCTICNYVISDLLMKNLNEPGGNTFRAM